MTTFMQALRTRQDQVGRLCTGLDRFGRHRTDRDDGGWLPQSDHRGDCGVQRGLQAQHRILRRPGAAGAGGVPAGDRGPSTTPGQVSPSLEIGSGVTSGLRTMGISGQSGTTKSMP